MSVNWKSFGALFGMGSSDYRTVRLDDDVERSRSGESVNNNHEDGSDEREAVNHSRMERAEGDGAVQWDFGDQSDFNASKTDGDDDAKAFTLPPAANSRSQLRAMLWRQWLFKVWDPFLRFRNPFVGLLQKQSISFLQHNGEVTNRQCCRA